jgi:hypothetical protein
MWLRTGSERLTDCGWAEFEGGTGMGLVVVVRRLLLLECCGGAGLGLDGGGWAAKGSGDGWRRRAGVVWDALRRCLLLLLLLLWWLLLFGWPLLAPRPLSTACCAGEGLGLLCVASAGLGLGDAFAGRGGLLRLRRPGVRVGCTWTTGAEGLRRWTNW